MTRATRQALAELFGVDPHGPVWVRALPGGRYKAGCRQCGCGEVFGDAPTTRLFLHGHRAGTELVAKVAGR